MYKVLLVDDEPAIRAGLRTIVDWAGKGFEVIGDASNGREAIAKHKELSPDLIVIDIRMPGMDGLQAIGEIRSTDKQCHILILSGFADFSYAKEAIVHGVDGYILKPMDEDEMEEELERIRKALDKETQQAQKRELGTGARREETIQSLLLYEGPAAEREQLERELAPLLGPGWKLYQIVLVEMMLQEGQDPATVSLIKRRWAEAFDDTGTGFVFSSGSHLGLLIKEDAAQPSNRKDVARKLTELAGDDIRYVAAAGEAVRNLGNIRKSYNGALHLLKRSFLLKGQEIHTEKQLWPAPDEVRPLQSQPDVAVQSAAPDLDAYAQQLFYALDIGSREGVEEALKEAGDRITAYDYSESYIKKSFAHILTVVLNRITVAHSQEAMLDVMPLVADLYRAPYYGEMMDMIRERLHQLAFRLCNESNVPVMKQVLDFINRHYYENLKLESLAELFKYNSGYLGKMFKQHTGENFNTYLDKVRIRHAIELLGEGLKVHQVADRVGYANVDYFHSKFKKYVGESPSSFKGNGVKVTPEI